MIIHLTVPTADSQLIKESEGKDFRIINWFYENKLNQNLFIIDTTEEQLTYYTLRYGRNNVWKR